MGERATRHRIVEDEIIHDNAIMSHFLQERTTDRLLWLEALCDEWNAGEIERRMRTHYGRKRLLKELRESVPRVA